MTVDITCMSEIITWAGSLRVLKWAEFVFRIIIFIFIFLGSTSGLMLIGSRPRDTLFVVSHTVSWRIRLSA